MHPDFFLDKTAEKQRYDHHNPDVHNQGYRNFVNPIVTEVLELCTPQQSGLDFGSGQGPVVSVMLKEKGYHIDQYDIYYAPDKKVLQNKFDYIVCSEVMEHFHEPAKEFQLLYDLLNPEGVLICMTHIYSPEIDFKNWYYKNDKTHTFFYTDQTLEFICSHWGYRSVKKKDRVIVWKK